jgi:magnesium transporter
VEDLLEYYLQRATAIQNEAERLLEGARDLEESIGVSLSARRYEVNRLELMLSMGSFAAALGAMIAGIFGMNMRSTLEMSVLGFWGTTMGIVTLCVLVFIFIFRYTQKRKIL